MRSFKSLVLLDSEKSTQSKWESNLGSSSLEADALTAIKAVSREREREISMKQLERGVRGMGQRMELKRGV